MKSCTPFEPRTTTRQGLVATAGWRLKHWRIVYGDGPFDDARFAAGRAMAMAALPRPAVTDERPGVGFLIEHQGNATDYVVLGWWDRQNELPLRVFVRDGEWRPARDSESVCVWDLEVIWREREAYVTRVLRPEGPDLAAYLR